MARNHPSESMKRLKKDGYTGVGLVSFWVAFHDSGYNARLAEALRALVESGVLTNEYGDCRWCNSWTGGHKKTCVVESSINLLAKLPKPESATGQRAAYRGGFRKDFKGFADILCFRREHRGCLFVQCTTKQAVSDHLLKYRREPKTRAAILACLASGNRFVIHGWEKTDVPNKSGEGSHVRWVCHEYEVTTEKMELTDRDLKAIKTKGNE